MAGRCRSTGLKRGCEAGQDGNTEPHPVLERQRPLTPGQCRAYMRRRLAHEFQGIVNGFIESARAGSCQHVKLATELLEPRKRQTKKAEARGTLQRWVEEIERED